MKHCYFLLCIFLAVTSGAQNQNIPSIYDVYGRTLILHGLNTAGGAKQSTGHQPWIAEADVQREDTAFGFNVVRYLIFWGAIEPVKDSFDEHYLQEVKRRVEWYTGRKMYVVFDMHQDVFGYGVGDNGAPEWASAHNAIIKHLVPNKWPWWMRNLEPKIIKSYVQFFAYKKYKERQQHYIACYKKVVAMFKDNPYVLGYDLMNEPHGGKIVKTLAGGFERRQLSAFYKRLIPAIRGIDTSKYIFFEPRSFGVNFGMPSHLPRVHDSVVATQKLVYAPHCYPAFVDVGGDYKPKNKRTLEKWFKVRNREMGKQQAPAFVGEFGLSYHKKGFDVYLQDFNALTEKYHMGWAYWASDPGGWGPYKADRTPSPTLNEILRVYPQATAGKLLTYSYNPQTKVFEMQFMSNDSIKTPTEIAVPKMLYPGGYHVTVTGAKKYHTSVNTVTNALELYVEDDSAVVNLQIMPKAKN
jgi:endoglycosylceramidase